MYGQKKTRGKPYMFDLWKRRKQKHTSQIPAHRPSAMQINIQAIHFQVYHT